MRRVADAMRAPAVVVEPGMTLQETSARMLDAAMQVAIVVDGGTVCGMVTADRLADALGEGYDPAETLVGVIAERDPPVVEADEVLAEAHERMQTAGRTRVPVVTADRRPVGILEHTA